MVSLKRSGESCLDAVRKNPEISVIVPVYNTEQYLHRCLDSILNQTFKNIDLILVDDGSTDKSGDICAEYASKYCNTHVIHQKNKGQSAARNIGLDYAYQKGTSQYIGFIDSDDWLHPQMYEILYRILNKHHVKMSVCSYRDVKELIDIESKDITALSVVKSEKITREQALERLFTEKNDMFGLVMPKLYDKELFQNRRFEEGVIYEDTRSCYKVLFEAGDIAVTYSELYYYYYNCTSTTKAAYTYQRLGIIDAMEGQLQFFKEHGLEKIYNLAVKKYLYLLAYHGKLAHSALSDPEVDKKIMKRMKELFWQERSNIKLTPQNSPDCYNMLFPRIMPWYWRMYALKEKLGL